MARGIKLRRAQIKNANHWHLRGFRLDVRVMEAIGGMDQYVFVFRRHPPDPYTGVIFDEFCGVASVVDLAEYPVGAPDPDSGTHPFFRSDHVCLDVRSSAHHDEVWLSIQNEVCNLVEALDRFDILEVAEEIWCGEQPEEEVSESASESVSESVSS